jgi:hypothetical protein
VGHQNCSEEEMLRRRRRGNALKYAYTRKEAKTICRRNKQKYEENALKSFKKAKNGGR